MHDFRLLLDRVRMFKFSLTSKNSQAVSTICWPRCFADTYTFVHFIEFALGLGYLTHAVSRFLYAATIGVTIFGSPGVLNSLP
jgi:hypothetical protein